MSQTTLALDVYGTLIDTKGVLLKLREHLGDQAEAFSDLWRDKQLEYSFRRGLMNKYVDFSICTQEAFSYTSLAMGITWENQAREEVIGQYRTLPAFPEVAEALKGLKAAGFRLFAYSNGSRKAVTQLMEQAQLLSLLNGIVSMEEVQTFKPNPVGYRHFIQQTESQMEQAWMISGNPFDVIGAKAYGMKTAWIQRNPQRILDPMGYTPDRIIQHLGQLAEAIITP